MGMVFGFGFGLGFRFGCGLGCWGGSWSFARFPLSFATFLAFGTLFAFELALGLAFGRFSFGVDPFSFAFAAFSFLSFGSFFSFTTSRGAASALDEVSLRLVNVRVDKWASAVCITSRARLCPVVALWRVSVFAVARLLEGRTMTFGDPFPAWWGIGVA